MSDHPVAARYRELTAAAEAGDMSVMAEAIANDVEWWMIGAPEPLRGRTAVVEMMGFVGDFDVQIGVHDVVANDNHLIALLNVTARKGSETLEYRTAEIHHINQDGLITQRWAFSDDTQAIIDFFG